jgi:hypothetical protein
MLVSEPVTVMSSCRVLPVASVIVTKVMPEAMPRRKKVELPLVTALAPKVEPFVLTWTILPEELVIVYGAVPPDIACGVVTPATTVTLAGELITIAEPPLQLNGSMPESVTGTSVKVTPFETRTITLEAPPDPFGVRVTVNSPLLMIALTRLGSEEDAVNVNCVPVGTT